MIRHEFATILGDIPSDWEAKPLHSLLRQNFSGDWGEDAGEVSVSVLRSTNFSESGDLNCNDVARRGFPISKARELQVQVNDILIERSGGGPNQPVGRVAFIRDPLPETAFSNFVQLLRPDPSKIHPELLFWILHRFNRCGWVERLQHQTTQMRNLDLRDYLRVLVPVPRSESEQRRIASAISASNAYALKVEQEAEKAERVKRALLNTVFTEGMPGGPGSMKYKWGTAPIGWVEFPIRGLLAEPLGNGTSPEAARANPPGFPTLNVSSVRNGRCDQVAISYIDLSPKVASAFAVQRDDFFVVRGNGNRDFVAIGGLFSEEPQAGLVFSDLLIRLRFNKEVTLPSFMNYLWQSSPFLRRLQSYAITGSGLWKIGQRSINHLQVAIPKDIEEQRSIIHVFDANEALLGSIRRQLYCARRAKDALLQGLIPGVLRIAE